MHSRFNPQGTLNVLADGARYNRSYRLTPTPPRGAALLMHGLTDSPYSMKALAESLYARGFDVTVLRLPGHGTLPSMMLEMSHRDWVGGDEARGARRRGAYSSQASRSTSAATRPAGRWRCCMRWILWTTLPCGGRTACCCCRPPSS